MHDDPRPGSIPAVQRTAPERIYMCVSDDLADRDEHFPSTWGVTWARNEAALVTVPYVRADLAALAAPKAEAWQFPSAGQLPEPDEPVLCAWSDGRAGFQYGMACIGQAGYWRDPEELDRSYSTPTAWQRPAPPTSPAPQEEA